MMRVCLVKSHHTGLSGIFADSDALLSFDGNVEGSTDSSTMIDSPYITHIYINNVAPFL